MASTICSLILDSTSEEALVRYPEFNLVALSQLIKRGLVSCGQDSMAGDGEVDLHEKVSSSM